jgi:ribose 5-phosphate isomerase B
LLIQISFVEKNKMTEIVIGCDHAGYTLKEKLKSYLSDNGFNVNDFGCNSEVSIDYPDYAHPVANKIGETPGMKGILICGSANGISISANKHQGIRSAICWIPEIAKLARQHNDANILALPARFISEALAIEIVDTFFNTEFEGGRHQKRVDKIAIS